MYFSPRFTDFVVLSYSKMKSPTVKALFKIPYRMHNSLQQVDSVEQCNDHKANG